MTFNYIYLYTCIYAMFRWLGNQNYWVSNFTTQLVTPLEFFQASICCWLHWRSSEVHISLQFFFNNGNTFEYPTKLGMTTWMTQEVSKWLGSMGCNLLINGVYWGYNQFTNHLLTLWDIQVK